MPPSTTSTQQGHVAAPVNLPLDGGQLHEEEEESSDEDEDTDPLFYTQPRPQIVMAIAGIVTVCLHLNKNVVCYIDFSSNITHQKFFKRVYANMALDCATAELGWKSSDEPEHGPVHRLASNNSDDLDSAFRNLLKKKSQASHQQEVFMEIIHLNPTPINAQEKQSIGNQAPGCVYSAELRLIQKKLLCRLHTCPFRWCYVPSNKSDVHIGLGYEEINLWARSIYNNEADPECLRPPGCLQLADVPRMEGHRHTIPASGSLIPPNNNAPVLPEANMNQAAVPEPSTQNLKRSHSVISTEDSSNSDDDGEALLLSDVIDRLHHKFPQLNLPRYIPLFEQEDIIYAETVGNFTKDFYIGLGLTEGAASQLLSSTNRMLMSERKDRKRARAYREYSAEI